MNATCVECLEVRRKANMHWFRAHDKKRDAGRREYKSACERKNRQQPHRRAARAAERRARQAAVLQRTPAWADHEKIKAFYRLAAAFSDLHIPHHVDHILPLNGELVSGLHVEHNLQVIPAIDNLRKGAQLLAA